MDIAFEVNENTPDVRFLASLSDGRTVIQDDIKDKRHAWLRLQKFLESNTELSITGLRLQCGDKTIATMPSNQQGYFFGMKGRKVHPGGEAHYVGLGYYDGQVVTVNFHRLPNLDHMFSEDKTRAQAGFMLIENE